MTHKLSYHPPGVSLAFASLRPTGTFRILILTVYSSSSRYTHIVLYGILNLSVVYPLTFGFRSTAK